MYSSLVVEEFQMLFPSMLLMLGELFSTILITTIAVCMSLTLCLCSSVINESVKSSSLGFGVRFDPGVRPTSPLNLIINKNFNSDTALNSYWLLSNPPQYSLFAPPPPHPLNFAYVIVFKMILLGICSPGRSIWKQSFMSFLTRNSQISVVFARTYNFLTCEKIPLSILLDVSFLSRVKNIVRSSDWIELIYSFSLSISGVYIW